MYIIMGVHNYLQWNCHLERSTHWQTVCVETICKTLLLSLILVSCVSILVLPTPCPSPSHSPHPLSVQVGVDVRENLFSRRGLLRRDEGVGGRYHHTALACWKLQAPKTKLWLLNIKWIYVCCCLRPCLFTKEWSFRAIYSLTNSLCQNHKQNAIVFFELHIIRFRPYDRPVYVNSLAKVFCEMSVIT